MKQPIYIIDGARTPFLKARNAPGPFAAADLATAAGSALLARQRFLPEQLDEVILGCASPSPDEVNIGRVAALRMGCGIKVPGWTVMRNCASGMQALDSAMANIQLGRAQLVLAGGVDALSRAPLLYSDPMVRWFAGWMGARTLGQKLAMVKRFRPGYLAPVIGIMKGLTDPIAGQLMGQTAETLAWEFGITRSEMDAFAVESHRRVAAAQDAGHFADEIVPLVDKDGTVYGVDDGLRRDASMDGLARLKPFFDKTYGRVTPGNSSQITRWNASAFSRWAASSTASGPGWSPNAWALARCTPPRPFSNATGWGWPTSTCGKSTKPSPPRPSPACAPGRTTHTAARAWICPVHWVPSTRRASTWTVVPWPWGIRWGRAGRASCCTCFTRCAARAASAASPASASAAGWAGQ